MKCFKCNRETSRIYKVNLDGVEREIAYCNECLVEVLKNGLSPRRIPDESMDSLKRITKFSFDGEMKVFVEVPIQLLEKMFGEIWSPHEKENILNRRKLVFLERKLTEAIKNEDYRKASRLKQLITQIKKKTDVK
ncbi:UvrB/UvrC motif-containing protein [Thermotoga sp. KOL6]|uniref:UvrB/UvrC motif-containing protein n=1 Tax=Thermotoga sp. KOL6 TaxID=126741 RepID=UPI000C77A049|nr:UvrB/UvrC motif-containing protein [Thermotoga sp. KOL6]PLV60277.1 DNA helicase UvrBC [Thermotoga sp. KOL6]